MAVSCSRIMTRLRFKREICAASAVVARRMCNIYVVLLCCVSSRERRICFKINSQNCMDRGRAARRTLGRDGRRWRRGRGDRERNGDTAAKAAFQGKKQPRRCNRGFPRPAQTGKGRASRSPNPASRAKIPLMNALLRPANLPLTTQAAEGLPRRRFTVGEIEAMVRAGVIDEDERFELIGGEVVPMSPKGARHEWIKIELNRFFQRVAPEHLTIAPETTLRLDAATYLEPDFLRLPQGSRPKESRRPRRAAGDRGRRFQSRL